jgi:hypothetical protein
MNIHIEQSDYDYIPAFGSNNKNTEPVIRMKPDGSIIKINNRFVICTRCLDVFFMRKFKGGSLMCPDCSQAIHTKPRKHGELEYVTKFEFKFIKYCIEKSIPLENSTAYVGTKRVPFYIPVLGVFIDLKSNLCYDYKKPVINLYDNHIIIYPKTYVQVTRTIEKLCYQLKQSTQICTTHGFHIQNGGSTQLQRTI